MGIYKKNQEGVEMDGLLNFVLELAWNVLFPFNAVRCMVLLGLVFV